MSDYIDTNMGIRVLETTWEILLLRLAGTRSPMPITYSALADEINAKVGGACITPEGSRLRSVLDRVSRESHKRDGFMLSVLVVQKGEGYPGQGFYDLAVVLGYKVADKTSFYVEMHKRAAHSHF